MPRQQWPLEIYKAYAHAQATAPYTFPHNGGWTGNERVALCATPKGASPVASSAGLGHGNQTGFPGLPEILDFRERAARALPE